MEIIYTITTLTKKIHKQDIGNCCFKDNKGYCEPFLIGIFLLI